MIAIKSGKCSAHAYSFQAQPLRFLFFSRACFLSELSLSERQFKSGKSSSVIYLFSGHASSLVCFFTPIISLDCVYLFSRFIPIYSFHFLFPTRTRFLSISLFICRWHKQSFFCYSVLPPSRITFISVFTTPPPPPLSFSHNALYRVRFFLILLCIYF